MLGSSDRLADTYLSVLDRRLARAGYSLNRFADDVRVLATSWEEANDIIDYTAEGGRELGLVLSSTKTTVWLTERLDAQEAEDSGVLSHYIAAVSNELAGWIDEHGGPYGVADEADEKKIPEGADALRAAYWSLLHDWHEAFLASRRSESRQRGVLGRHIASALATLVDHAEGVEAELMDDLMFDDPTRFETLSRYVMARHQAGRKVEARAALTRLLDVRRQGPWAKLWGLHMAEAFGPGPRAIPRQARVWVEQQIEDPHEVVRAQAAWVLALRGELTDDHLEYTYPRATTISTPALSAAAARQQATAKKRGALKLRSNLVKAISDDGRLNFEAAKWAS